MVILRVLKIFWLFLVFAQPVCVSWHEQLRTQSDYELQLLKANQAQRAAGGVHHHSPPDDEYLG